MSPENEALPTAPLLKRVPTVSGCVSAPLLASAAASCCSCASMPAPPPAPLVSSRLPARRPPTLLRYCCRASLRSAARLWKAWKLNPSSSRPPHTCRQGARSAVSSERRRRRRQLPPGKQRRQLQGSSRSLDHLRTVARVAASSQPLLRERWGGRRIIFQARAVCDQIMSRSLQCKGDAQQARG